MKKCSIHVNREVVLTHYLLNKILKLNKLLRNILYFGFVPESHVERKSHDGIYRVAAGDPTKGVRILNGMGNLPEKLKCDDEIIEVLNYTVFEVYGSSMAPEGISDGDRLLSVPVKEISEITSRSFIIIKTDEKYYDWKKRELKFEYKLRYSLTKLPISLTVDSLIEELKTKTNSILLPENEENLRAKFKDAHDFYDNKGITELMLSVTYREGVLRYSFHPTSLVKYKAIYVLKCNNGEWVAKKL